MATVITKNMAPRLAGLHLHALLHAGVLPSDVFQSGRVSKVATTIYDINGDPLFYRVPIVQGSSAVGFADIAAFGGFGAILLAVSQGMAWDEKSLYESALVAAKKQKKPLRSDNYRFVAYSYPKIAVQFLAGAEEVIMIELGSGAVVPPLRRRPENEPPSNFERWSLIDETSSQKRGGGERVLEKALRTWDELCPPQRPPRGFDPVYLKAEAFERAFEKMLAIKVDTREVHYSLLDTDHAPCFELRGQLTNVWCVAASVQMVLDFYRYSYAQTRVATQLGLGTTSSPIPLPYTRDGDVVTALETLTSNALDANMSVAPTWPEFRTEIRANRPVVSFVPGHSRAIAGYTSTRIFTWFLFRGLLVYDPWPPTTGVITRWENFDATTYRRTFTANLTLV